MTRTFPIELEEELHKRLKIAAIEEGLTLQEWILRALAEKVGAYGNRTNRTKKNGRDTERSNSR